MNYIILLSLALISMFGSMSVPVKKNLIEHPKKIYETPTKKDTLHLFDGKNMDNFIFVMDKLNPDKKDKYEIKNGVVHLYGIQHGYFRTKEIFSNYELHAEWRWPEENEKANGGILVHTQLPDSVWPECIQVQLKEGRAGDFIAMNGAELKETNGKPKNTAPMIVSSSEKKEGEWNSCDVICTKSSILVYINQRMQNSGSESNFQKGFIGFQMEGKPIEFRNIYVIKLDNK